MGSIPGNSGFCYRVVGEASPPMALGLNALILRLLEEPGHWE